MKNWNRIEKKMKITFIEGLNPDKMKTTEPSLLVIDDLRLVIYFKACQTIPTAPLFCVI